MSWDIAWYRKGLKSARAEQQFTDDIEALEGADSVCL